MGRVKNDKKRALPSMEAIFSQRSGGLKARWYQNTLSFVLAIVVATVVIVSILIASYYYSTLRSGMETKAETTNSFFESYIAQSYHEFYDSCIIFAQNFEDKNDMELQFVDLDGRLVASSFAQWSGIRLTTPEIDEAILQRKTSTYSGSDPRTGERILAVSTPLIYSNGEVIGVMRYVTSLRFADRQALMIAGAVILIGLAFMAFVTLGSNYFLRSILEPIAEITVTAKRIAAGSYGSHIQKISKDEIGELAETINEMSDAISRTERMQTELVSSVSHELRTPLTAITGWGETLLAEQDIPREDFERGMGIMLSEARRLTGMVEELLEFTRIQDGRMTLNVALCDIRSELEDTIFMYASKLKEEGILLDYLDNDDDVPEIRCDISRLKQVFFNLLDNAVKHGGEGKKITAAICRKDMDISIQIRDFGPGIPEEELPLVKSRFYKGSSKARGNGIGLAVCDEIVKLHNGTLTLSNAEGGGTLVEIRLPVDEEMIEE
ncbi:MAG: HAMP domain-containing protein [Oscillospiraceae bacterium]|nr:HAMP domain-containing protein [Oscillospiraceae bacterium]